MRTGLAGEEGRAQVRRFAWQIGGLTVAIAAIVVLAVLAFGRGSSGAPVRATVHGTPTPRVTPTADVRVAEVEAAARRYIEALATSMHTGSPTDLDALSVQGSQAQGNAGIAAGIVQNKHVAFVVTNTTFTSLATDVNTTTAEVTLDYTLSGYDADWPSLKARSAPRNMTLHSVLDFSLVGGQWLVDSSR